MLSEELDGVLVDNIVLRLLNIDVLNSPFGPAVHSRFLGGSGRERGGRRGKRRKVPTF
jgi:hypothetical protein